MNLTLQPNDLNEFGTLPKHVRDEVDAWRTRFEAVTKPVTKALENIARATGVSFATVRRKYSAWQARGWRGLVNCAKAPTFDADAAVSKEFIEWFKALVERNQRKTKPAWRKFCSMWKAGEQIPGLDNELPRYEIPPGCSYANLSRKVKDAFALEAMRKGLGSAVAKYGPKIFSTRANLYVGSHLMIDDLWHDNFVVFRGKMVRVLELDALDVFSACKIAWGCKPRFQREDGTFDNLKEKYARLIVAKVFFCDGFSERGTEILAEHGTAAISERVARILFDRTGGLIRLRESGITEKEQVILGQRGQGKGNPRFKAALESLRNLIHNELGDVSGQTGKDVLSRPEFLHGELKECEDLLKAIVVLAKDRPDRAALIKLNLLEYHSQFLPLLGDVYQRINARDWHNLEGWHAAGNIAVEYRTDPFSDRWLNDAEFSSLPAPIRDGVLVAAQDDRRFLQERKLSPAEVFSRGREQLVRLPAFVVGEILGDDYAQERSVVGAYFREFCDMEISPEPLRFESVVQTPEGERLQLRDDKYLTFVNPFAPEQMFVHDARGVHIGIARLAVRVDRLDEESVHREFGNRARRLAELKAPIQKRHAQIVKERAALMANNADVLAGAPVTPEEKERAAQIKANVKEFGAEAAETILESAAELHSAEDGTAEFNSAALCETESPDSSDLSDAIL